MDIYVVWIDDGWSWFADAIFDQLGPAIEYARQLPPRHEGVKIAKGPINGKLSGLRSDIVWDKEIQP